MLPIQAGAAAATTTPGKGARQKHPAPPCSGNACKPGYVARATKSEGGQNMAGHGACGAGHVSDRAVPAL